ncbi:glycosyltransferase family 39 protein [Phototrophicus methaneseepsis]|uniref:Glycosyltransferase family 39 protein n=1 Tax=Phototrophicus methaneseepsis TaxID=2710758 RepID=A0A7S8EC96_9CHLR|nr:glycosyltransferase family 39 protein [Phototrophicus methaneseepsis]QPC84320.1 glycosyltransferase family 39 protein [Phototrophicus methaneseepsis]
MLHLLVKYRLGIVLLLATIIRLACMMAFAPTLDFTLPGNVIHGSDAYDDYAQNLLATGIYGRTPLDGSDEIVPDAAVPPLYSYALAGVYGLFGRGYVQVALFHILIDAICIVLLYDIARRLFREGALWGLPVGEWVGLLGGLFYAFYPYLIFQNLTLIDTPFWMLWLHLFTWLVILLRERETLDAQTWGIAVLAGVVLGLSLLTRPIMPFFAVFVALWYLFRLNLWQSVIRLLPVALVGLICLLPWIVRNYGLYDAFVPMTTTSGANLWQGNSEWTVPMLQAGYDVQWTAPETVAPRDSREADAERFALSLAHWREHPEQLPELLWTKFLVHWSIEIAPRYNPQPDETFQLDEAGHLLIVRGDGSITGVNEANTAYDSGLLNTVGRPAHILYFGGLLLLSIVGVALSLNQWREVSLLWFVQISMTLTYVLFHPSTRYRAPSDPLLFLFAAYTLVWLVMRWQRRTT